MKEIILEGIRQDPNFPQNYDSKLSFSPGV